ncbi:flagellar protein FliT [Photobacterium halotolerans]|uniref:flagellar protein FliT n=1 Tax=Photobacterium halotolerans TaxID=265726 RepID=UPI00041A0DEF|nr:flagellar protein FliT [Photobacterium halotolerans]
MPNITVSQLEALRQHLDQAAADSDWDRLQQLDQTLQKVLRNLKGTQLTEDHVQALAHLKSSHQTAIAAVNAAKDKLQQDMNAVGEGKEGLLAYQMAMNMEL